MNAVTEPVTEIQVKRLRQFGYVADGSLTRSEAARLLHEFETRPELRPVAPTDALELRRAVDNLRLMLVQATTRLEEDSCRNNLEAAKARRREFWLDTCREPDQRRSGSPQRFQLYMQHGCRFYVPSLQQTQEILDALDAAMPTWDGEHPELFYQTLELSFPALVRRC